MTTDLKAKSIATSEALRLVDEVDLEAMSVVQRIADRLDDLRRLVADLGPAVLIAEIRQIPTPVVMAALEEATEGTAHALDVLRRWGDVGH